MRVKVTSGDLKRDLGEGTYTEDVWLYYGITEDGSLVSAKNPEVEPKLEDLPGAVKIARAEQNPKIRLDSGEVIYGCQCWWVPVEGED